MTTLERLIDQQYVEVDLPIPKEALEDCFEAFLDTLKLHERDLLTTQLYRRPKGENETPLGYTRKECGERKNQRTGEFEYQDGKRYLHIDAGGDLLNTGAVRKLASRAPAFRVLLDRAMGIARRMEQFAIPLLEEIGERWPDVQKQFMENGCIPNLQIRLLAYDEKEGAEVAAIAHKDKSGLTNTMWESHDGLFFIANGKVIEAPNTSVLMAGETLEKATNGIVRALPHLVKQPHGAPLCPGISRGAMICFIDPKVSSNLTQPNWQQLHAVG